VLTTIRMTPNNPKVDRRDALIHYALRGPTCCACLLDGAPRFLDYVDQQRGPSPTSTWNSFKDVYGERCLRPFTGVFAAHEE
jgi:hypothetical protein